ncbi:MAG: DUF1810 domain-containing protein [Pseudomonadota bacterium]
MSETDPDLFLEAQDTVWDAVLGELTAGRKTSHWMWFIFPQLAELGQSHISQLYGIHDLAEATDYLAQPKLRGRLVQVSQLILTHHDKPAESILGSVDAKKLKSSMTLFSCVPDAPEEFALILETFYDGQPCQRTLDLIR